MYIGSCISLLIHIEDPWFIPWLEPQVGNLWSLIWIHTKTPVCTWSSSGAVRPISLRWLMWVWSSFRVCVPIMRPAVPSLRLIDESGTFRERDTHTGLSSGPAGVPHHTKDATKCLVLKEGDNQARREHRFFVLKSDNQALQLSRWRPYLRGGKQQTLLQTQQPTAEAIPLLLSRVLLHTSRSRRRPATREKAENELFSSLHLSLFLLFSFTKQPLLNSRLELQV